MMIGWRGTIANARMALNTYLHKHKYVCTNWPHSMTHRGLSWDLGIVDVVVAIAGGGVRL